MQSDYLTIMICSLLVDHTRVKLRDGEPNVVGSDYVNANIITVSRAFNAIYMTLL